MRVVAHYLPQFHPIPENDEWWGAGFTEWTNVAGARPLFPGHRQPLVPGDLGFYDLRVPETRDAQASLARRYGVDAFCYWHYWFAGRRILERPFGEVLASGHPDFPFCLGWANQSWTGIWHGAPDRLLIEQTYPGEADDRAHFAALLPALRDRRYLLVDGRPLFYVYAPHDLPDPAAFVARWRAMAFDAGFAGLYLVAEAPDGFDAIGAGFDAYARLPWREFVASRATATKVVERVLRLPKLVRYESLVEHLVPKVLAPHQHVCVIPNWDNTPRSGRRGVVMVGSTPAAFEQQVRAAVRVTEAAKDDPEHRLLFVKSWNEWAEGNHLEPDRRHGHGWLEALARGLGRQPGRTPT